MYVTYAYIYKLYVSTFGSEMPESRTLMKLKWKEEWRKLKAIRIIAGMNERWILWKTTYGRCAYDVFNEWFSCFC